MITKHTYTRLGLGITGVIVLMAGPIGCSILGEQKNDSGSDSAELSSEVEKRSLEHISRAIEVMDASSGFVGGMNHVESFGQAIDALGAVGVGLDSSVEEMSLQIGQELRHQSQSLADIGPVRRIGGRIINRLRLTDSSRNSAMRSSAVKTMAMDQDRRLGLNAKDSVIARKNERSETFSEVDSMIQELLRDKIFYSDNIESSSGNKITYSLNSTSLCEYNETTWDCDEDFEDCSVLVDESSDGERENAKEENTSVDEECVEMMDALQIRVVATIYEEDQLKLSIQIGEDRIEPLSFDLSSGRYICQVDIGAVVKTAALAAEAVEEEIELPERALGRVQSSFEVLGDNAMASSFSVVEDIELAFVTDEGPWRIQAATSDPLSLLVLDAQLESILGAFNMGAVDLSFPQTTLSTQTSGNQIDIYIAGASATTQVSSRDESFDIRNLSLGQATSWMKRNGAPVASIDINEELGRSFGLTVEPDPSGISANISIDPVLTIIADFLLEDLAQEIGWPENWVDDRYEIVFDGDSNPIIYPYTSETTNESAIAVRNGSMLIRIADGREIFVESEQCLIRDEVMESNEHPLLGSLRTGSCP